VIWGVLGDLAKEDRSVGRKEGVMWKGEVREWNRGGSKTFTDDSCGGGDADPVNGEMKGGQDVNPILACGWTKIFSTNRGDGEEV
jgi:hypothetical protein